jgi:uncharacterized protein (DUF58 family)
VNVELRNALLRGRRRPRNLGAGSPTTLRGDGYEFAELRQYVAGDDFRRIDWAATARAGALQTRVVLEDVALTLATVLDDSGSMQLGRLRPLAAAAHDAMAAWYECANADDRCARIDGSGLVAPPGLRGFASAMICVNAAVREPLQLGGALEVARAALPRGAAVLVISDFFGVAGRSNAGVLRDLAQRFDCTALVARDPWYDGLPVGGFVRFADAETGEQRNLFLGRKERERYLVATRKREAEILETLSAAGWRTGIMTEADGRHALLAAFGLR